MHKTTAKIGLHTVDFFALFLIRFLIWTLQWLPFRQACYLSLIYVRGIVFFMPRLVFVSRRNLELVFPEKDLKERDRIFQQSLAVLGGNLVEFAKIPQLTEESARQLCDVSSVEAVLKRPFKSKLSNGWGSFFLVPHLGSFELLAQVCALVDQSYAILTRGFGLPKLDAWWNARREMHGNRVFTRVGGYPEIIRRLRRGENVVMLFDQNVKRSHAVFVDLFNMPAATTKTIGLVAARTKSQIFFATMVENQPRQYQLVVEAIENPVRKRCETKGRIEDVTRRVNESLERIVRKYPEQWYWIHRRFKTRPDGQEEELYARRSASRPSDSL